MPAPAARPDQPTRAPRADAKIAPPPRDLPLAVAGCDAPVAVHRSLRARRLTLRVDPRAGTARVVAPVHVPPAEIARFVARHAGWLRRRLAAIPPPFPFAPGAVVPFLGVAHRVHHDPAARPPVARHAGVLTVGGRLEHLARRLRAYLIAEARRELTARSHALARTIGRRVAAVAVRDTRSRWGSCSPAGRLNYCWRLILAPESVLDYVVAHEVAHLAEPNHSPRFWALVARLDPAAAAARAWLKAHGAELHRYG